jgi:hypothetical protein
VHVIGPIWHAVKDSLLACLMIQTRGRQPERTGTNEIDLPAESDWQHLLVCSNLIFVFDVAYVINGLLSNVLTLSYCGSLD